jgi:hypothetical protein
MIYCREGAGMRSLLGWEPGAVGKGGRPTPGDCRRGREGGAEHDTALPPDTDWSGETAALASKDASTRAPFRTCLLTSADE